MALKLYEEFAIIDRYLRVIAETCSPNAGETERQINDRYSFTTTKNTILKLVKVYELPKSNRGGAHHFNGARKKGDFSKRKERVGEKTWERRGSCRRYVGKILIED